MKIFRNGICYVNADRVTGSLPINFKFERLRRNRYIFLALNDDSSINYIMNRKDIVNYDDVCLLTEEELKTKIKEVSVILTQYVLKYLKASSDYQKKVDNNEDTNENYKLYDSIYKQLFDYQNNREEIDNVISSIVNNNENNDSYIK